MAFQDFHIHSYWNAATNKPRLVSGMGMNGRGYMVGTSGATSLDGNTVWLRGDLVIFVLDQWVRFTPFTLDTLSALFSALPTTMPVTPGVAWNNGGVIQLS
jgi:hypothetical protein